MTAFLLSVLPAVWAALPLFGKAFIPTHDGEYHIIRFAEFFTMLSSGYPFPRWAPNLNSGYGVPLFNFHYPFPNYIGSLVHLLGWSFVDGVKLTLALGYLGTVTACFFWLKRLFTTRAAVVGTILFSYVPYWFVDIYVRGSVGEVWAICFLFLALLAVEYDNRYILSLAVGGLIVSHNILSMLFLPYLTAYLFLRRKNYYLWLALGVGLASYFWLPALVERQYVVGLNTVNYRDHFPDFIQLLIPSWGTGFSGPGFADNEMSFQLGLMPIVIFLTAGSFLITEKDKRIRRLIFGALVGIVLAIVLMLEASDSAWKALPFLQLIQYPWRLLSFLLPAVALFAGYVAGKIKLLPAMLVSVVAIILSFSYTRPVFYQPRTDQYYLTKKEFTDGTSSLGNSFSTQWTPWKSVRPTNKVEVVTGNGDMTPVAMRPLEYVFDVSARETSTMKVNTLYYPGWVVRIDGKPVPIQFEDEGIIKFNIESGVHRVRINFFEIPLRKLADTISLVSLFWLMGSGILAVYAYRNRRNSSGKRK